MKRVRSNFIVSILCSGLLLVTTSSFARGNIEIPKPSPDVKLKTVDDLIQSIRARVKKKYKWDLSVFSFGEWKFNGYTVNGQPMIYWTCGSKKSKNRSLFLSSVHGDEVTPIYFGFRLVEWLKARHEQLCEDRFIVVAPIVNPDGFLRYKNGTRSNFNKVDLNRNFDTPDWNEHALKRWKKRYNSRRRYFPGNKSASEPETLFQKWLIDEFKPQKIMSVHAPLNVLDYDGPKDAYYFSKAYLKSCEELRQEVHMATPDLRFFAYGVFPGSLGNYAGHVLGIPTITTELPTIKHRLAGYYFGLMEKGIELFIKHDLKK